MLNKQVCRSIMIIIQPDHTILCLSTTIKADPLNVNVGFLGFVGNVSCSVDQ